MTGCRVPGFGRGGPGDAEPQAWEAASVLRPGVGVLGSDHQAILLHFLIFTAGTVPQGAAGDGVYKALVQQRPWIRGGGC